MAADIGPQSLTHELQQLAQQQPNPSFLMWSSRRTASEDDSWEVRAFAEDTSSIKGSTWPPRSYPCSFCKREFRSAQALGGHMNVHRRDRARLHQSSLTEPSPPSTYSSPLKLYDRELVTSDALSLLRPFSNPNPNPLFTPASMSASSLDFPSTLLSISPYAVNNFSTPGSPSIDLPLKTATNTSPCGSVKVEFNDEIIGDSSQTNYEPGLEELDLELRLGQRSPLQAK